MPVNVLESLFREYAAKLQRYLLHKTKDPELAADLAQEAFARIARMTDFHAVANQPSYLFRTANNLLVDHFRQGYSRIGSTEEGFLEQLEDPGPGPEDVAQREVDMSKLKAILLTLPPNTRAAFQLCRFQGLTHEQAAKHLGISVSMVQKHLARAIAAISAVFGDDE